MSKLIGKSITSLINGPIPENNNNNSNSSHVIYNNNILIEKKDKPVIGDVVIEKFLTPSLSINEIKNFENNINYDSLVNPYLSINNFNSNDFIKKYAFSLKDILTISDIKLITNFIDQSGKIVFCEKELIELIAEYFGIKNDFSNINIIYQTFEPTCWSKFTKNYIIDDIQIFNRSLKMSHNEHYNILTNTYKICLTHTVPF